MKLNWRTLFRFADLQKALGYTLQQMESLVNSNLTQLSYTRADVLKMLEVSDDDFSDNLLTPNTRTAQAFKLKQRALHVFQGKPC